MQLADRKKSAQKIFKVLSEHNPKPTTELVYHSTFELLIAVMLSAQATDISVNLATKTLFQAANTAKEILNLGEEKLKEHIKSIGLFNTKAKNIIKTCKILFEQYNSKVPDTLEELESLPGVGRKTANVILNTAFRQATIAVDTHVHRVSNRLSLSKGSTPLQVEKDLLVVIPKKYLLDAHHWLILHGRYTCTARSPKCNLCLINKLCNYKEKKI